MTLTEKIDLHRKEFFAWLDDNGLTFEWDDAAEESCIPTDLGGGRNPNFFSSHDWMKETFEKFLKQRS